MDGVPLVLTVMVVSGGILLVRISGAGIKRPGLPINC